MSYFEYPIDYDMYNLEEVEIIISFLSYIEENHKHYQFKEFESKYKLYRNTINSKAEEKRINKEFEELSGISIYQEARKLGL